MRARIFRMKTAQALTFVLFVSLFQTSTTYVADSAPTTISKTVVVRDSSGNLYPGAQVQLAYDDQSGTGVKGIDFSAAVTTNASGQAVVTAPDTVNWLRVVVQPPASDLTQGLTSRELNNDDETVNVSLQTSNFRAKIVKADGTDAKVHAQVYTNTFWFTTIRTGAFALALTAQDLAYGGYLGSCPAEDEIRSQGCTDFNIKNVTSGGISAYKLFETNGTLVTADGSNVFPVKFVQTNVSGTLLNSDGTPFVLADGVGASIHFYALRSDGSRWYELGSGLLRAGEDSWNAALRNWDSQALKIEVAVNFENSLTLGEVSAGNLWMNSAGSLSTTEAGTYTSTLNMALRVTPGTPTLGFVIKDSNGSLINASYYLYQPNTKVGKYASFPATKGNMTLPNGTFNLEIYPASGSKQLSSTYSVVVTGGVASITDSLGSAVSSTNRVFELILKPLNFKFVLSDPSTSAGLRIAPNVNLRKSVTNAKGTYWDYVDAPWIKLDSQTVGMWIPEGTFKLEVSPSVSDYYGKKTYDLVRSGNTITVNSAGPTLADSTFKLPLNIANFKFKIVDPNDLTAPLLNSWIYACNNDKDAGADGSDSCVSSGVNQEAQGAMYLATGTYSVMVDGGKDNTTKTYKATVNVAGVVSIESETAIAGRFSLHPTKPNLMGTIYHTDGTTPITFSETQTAVVEVEYTDNQGNTYRTEGRWLDQWNETFAFNLYEPGKYRLSVTPQRIGEYANTYSDYIYVNNSHQLSKTLASGYTSSLSDYKVALKTGNLPLTINNPIDGQPIKNGFVQIYSQVKQIWQYFDLVTAANGKINANFEANSEAFINVYPDGNPALIQKTYSLTVDADGIPTIRDGAVVVAKTGQRFVLTSNKSNISGQIVSPSGAQNSGIKLNVILQKSEKFNGKSSATTDQWFNRQGSGADSDGNFGFSIQEPGLYRIAARPYGSVDVALGVSETFTVTSENLSTFSKDLGKVRLTTPLLKLKAKVSGSGTFTTGYQVSILKNGSFIDNPFINSSGISAISIADPGTYDIVLTPPEDSARNITVKRYPLVVSSSAGVISNSITAGAGVSTSGEYTVLEFGTPNLSGQVRNPDSSTALADIYVVAVDATSYNELNQYSSVTDLDGKWSISLEKGTYKIYARAPWGSIAYTNSDYIGDVVVNETGTVTSLPAGLNSSNFTIKLTSPTWSGLVKNPDASAVVPYAGVCLSGYSSVFKGQYGWCTNADQQGRWAIKLPSTVTLNENSELSVYDWQFRSYPDLRVRGKSAIETLIGTSGVNKVLSFPSPNIEITVNAGSNPSIGSWVNVNTPTRWYGNAITNSSGVAGMYSDQITGPLTVYADINQQGDAIPSYVSTTKQYSAAEVTAATSAGKFSTTIALKQPNLKGIVRDPNTLAAIANTWVEIRNESDNEWMPGASLTSSGTFGVYLKGSCCSGTPKEYTITVNAPWDGSSKNVRKQYKALVNSSDVVTLYNKRTNELIGTESLNSTTLFSLSLQEPNLKAIVREPAVGGSPGAIASWSYGQYGSVSWAYADVFNVTNNEWLTWGQRVEADGTLSMYLPGGCCQSSKEYEVTLHPAWSSQASLVTKKYKVVVDYRDIPTVTDWRSGSTVSTESMTGTTYKALSLGAPNVTGAVVNMFDTGTAYSWVTFNPQITNWEEAKAKGYKGCGQDCYFYSGIDGKIATNLEDGNYDVNAQQKWWGEFEGAQSATCALKIETGTIKSGNNCLQNDGTIKLKLRSPNLTMTLNDGTGPVRNAWVSIGIGNYWTGARSDDNGYVGIYVDTQTVSSNNSGQSGSKKIRVYVDPPWASTTMARWNCESGDSKPICSGLSDYTLGSAFSQTNLGTIAPAKPNTKITITRPDTGLSAGWYNYVTVYRMNSGNLEWVGWSATNANGEVAINIETTTATANSKYQVFVQAEWNLRNEFTDKKYDNSGSGYTWAQVNNGTFALGSPNLKLTSLLPDAVTLNKWGWVGIETVNDSLTVTSWLTGAGLNEYGKASFTLPSSSKYKITVNPGPGRSGTSTSCFLQTDGSSTVSKIAGECASGDTLTATALNLTLARGNVIGKIQTAAGAGIAGAIIYANIDGAANDDGQVIACSNSAGDYGLILKPGLTYKIKVYPVNKADTTYLDNLSVPVLSVPSSGSTTLNVTLTS